MLHCKRKRDGVKIQNKTKDNMFIQISTLKLLTRNLNVKTFKFQH